MSDMKKNDENRYQNNYVLIFDWMIRKLELKGNKLLIYAAIYGFSQDGKSCFNGSLNYLSNLVNISRATVIRTLQDLTDAKLFFKENHHQRRSYKVNIDLINERVFGIPNQYQNDTLEEKNWYQNDTDDEQTGIKMQLDQYQNDTETGIKMIPNNKYNNKYIYMTLGEFKNVQLTEVQYNKLKEQDLLSYIERLSRYMESTGKEYKSHYATILNWYRKDHPETKKDDELNKEHKAPSIEELGDYLT